MKRKCSYCGEVVEGWGAAYLHILKHQKEYAGDKDIKIVMRGVTDDGTT
jgi:hypothetical protein